MAINFWDYNVLKCILRTGFSCPKLFKLEKTSCQNYIQVIVTVRRDVALLNFFLHFGLYINVTHSQLYNVVCTRRVDKENETFKSTEKT